MEISGIEPSLLLSQIDNTARFAFDSDNLKEFRKIIQDSRDKIRTGGKLSVSEYYALCLSAHWCTVGTLIPTDVDIHIRYKLWRGELDDESFIKMLALVSGCKDWDVDGVSLKWVRSPLTNSLISGHQGEWFSVAVAAYAVARRRDQKSAEILLDEMTAEIKRYSQVFPEFIEARDGIGRIKAAYVIAHNLGDCNRVMELWGISDEDPLKVEVTRYCSEDKAFLQVTDLNLRVSAPENHRFLALRKARALRKSADFILPIGPFFDEWGKKIARHKLLDPRDHGEIIEALVDGWNRLDGSKVSGTTAYARGLVGIESDFRGGFQAMLDVVPARVARDLKSGKLRTQCSVSHARFTEQWNITGCQK